MVLSQWKKKPFPDPWGKRPDALSEYSDEAKEAIKILKNVYQRINNREDVRRLSRMMKELKNDGEMSPEMYLWWVNRY